MGRASTGSMARVLHQRAYVLENGSMTVRQSDTRGRGQAKSTRQMTTVSTDAAGR